MSGGGMDGDFGSADGLRAMGFEGFTSVRDLRRDDCRALPRENGVYVLVRERDGEPRFNPRGTAAFWRGQDPNVKLEVLAEKWVPGARLVYVGRAAGAGVRGRLQQRVKRMLRFGEGRNVAHWSGRYAWQLADAFDLLVAWKVCKDAVRQEIALLTAFEARHEAMPFANLPHESGHHGLEEEPE
jgi:hypothetical protein